MRTVCGLSVLGCMLLTTAARAGDIEEIPLEKLPPALTDYFPWLFSDSELLRAWREMEDSKECYIISVMYKGEVAEYYCSPDGKMWLRKEREQSVSTTLTRLLVFIAVILVPGAIVGALARRSVQKARGNKVPAVWEWLVAWFGATISFGILISLLSGVSTVPREEKDLEERIAPLMRCMILGAISASLVEAVGLTVQSIRGFRTGCRRWIALFGVLAIILFALMIPNDSGRVERINQRRKERVLRPVTTDHAARIWQGVLEKHTDG